jgi:aminoglycoside phosphotransferase family enzyme/predicted kinase
MTRRAEKVADDQAEVAAFLSDPASYPERPDSVDKIATHGAKVFLAGSEAWTIKRAVRYPYMDLSTLEKRRAVCQRELEINRIWAPQLYLGCVPVTREPDGKLALGGDGEPVEWVVRMRRFPQSDLLGAIADNQGISSELARNLADMVFDSHVHAQRIDDPRGVERVTQLVTSVSRNLAGMSAILTPEKTDAFRQGAEQRLARAAPVLDQRAGQGLVRRCHGDLLLDNIVMWQGRPVLFDAIEFDEELARVDTVYDLAFLLMDLDHRQLRTAANTVLNRYLWRSQEPLDLEGLIALPLFLALRAGVRALVAAERAEQEQSAPGREMAASSHRERGRSYLRAALGYLDPLPPKLVAVGGLSGTGKSTLAAKLAPEIGSCPGAVHLRSDLERKALFGRGETDRLGPEAYTEPATARVYGTLMDKAQRVLKAGHSVIVDAVFAKPEERQRIADIGANAGVPLRGLWLTASPATLMERVAQRRNDASDATVDVVKLQLAYELGPLSSAWKTVDAGRDLEATAGQARAVLTD